MRRWAGLVWAGGGLGWGWGGGEVGLWQGGAGFIWGGRWASGKRRAGMDESPVEEQEEHKRRVCVFQISPTVFLGKVESLFRQQRNNSKLLAIRVA